MASTTIIVPGPERAAHVSAPRADGRARDDLRTAGINASRTPGSRGGQTDASNSAYDVGRLPRMVFGEPRGGLPFLAQQLAQDDSAAPQSTDSAAAPALRFAALRAYSAASESTIEFLSPTQHYDLRV